MMGTTVSPTDVPQAPAKPVLSLASVQTYIAESHILQGVSFGVAAGRVTVLLGRNGAGKTTTLRTILGLLPASSGTITLDGVDITGDPVHKIVRRGIGYVPEDRDVFAGLTVEQNLRLAQRPRAESERMMRAYELFPDLKHRATQRAGSLSGGQQQMVAIARALLNPNRLLLVDEPTKGLAPVVIRDVLQALETVAQETTILLVEQNLRVAERLATDVVVLDHGTVVHRGGMAELFAQPELVSSLLGVSAAPPESARP